ncbi:hypothetical protein AZA_44783 [Nitrospirillum viridazoti Y2]|nr:hypothetical protein AZA_44783 [Nitrospirillum amazonense Y2]
MEPQPAAALTRQLKPLGEFINAFRQSRVEVGIIHVGSAAQDGFKKIIALILDVSRLGTSAKEKRPTSRAGF